MPRTWEGLILPQCVCPDPSLLPPPVLGQATGRRVFATNLRCHLGYISNSLGLGVLTHKMDTGILEGRFSGGRPERPAGLTSSACVCLWDKELLSPNAPLSDWLLSTSLLLELKNAKHRHRGHLLCAWDSMRHYSLFSLCRFFKVTWNIFLVNAEDVYNLRGKGPSLCIISSIYLAHKYRDIRTVTF